jgi:hypothetical protein
MSEDTEKNLKVLNFNKDKETDSEQKTRYDFKFEDTQYNLKTKIYGNGILLMYLYEQKHKTPFGELIGMDCKSELFVHLSRFEKFLNLLGAGITVEDKVTKMLPQFKSETIERLEGDLELANRQKELANSLK